MIVGPTAAAPEGTHGPTLKRDQAYVALYHDIVRLRLAPGAVIDEVVLGQSLGLGRTPIREALQQLASDGLITIYPRRGMVVTPISIVDVQQHTEARLLIEPDIARLAARVGTPADWDALAAVLADCPARIDSEDDVAIAAGVDRRFHHGITAATGNRYLMELGDRMVRGRARMPFLFFQHGTYAPVTDQHQAILACLRQGDGDSAAQLIADHIKVTQGRQTKLRL